MSSIRCIAPRCGNAAGHGAFCAVHDAAPAGRRGGWISAHRRRLAMSESLIEMDCSNVWKRLWVGSAPNAQYKLEQWSMVVLCAAEYQPERVAWKRAVRIPLRDDRPTQAEVRLAFAGSRVVSQELARGGCVLVTCQAGLNRSALVASLALLRMTRMPPAEIIALMRTKRDARALFNQHFVALLEHAGQGR